MISSVNKPAISVLMPSFNTAQYIEDSIESVLMQNFIDWELVIIDDCSVDDSCKRIKKYLDDERIVFFKNEQNLGKAKTRKKLVEISRGDIFCELDSDDVLMPTALKEVYSQHLLNPSVGFIYSQFIYCDKNLKTIKKGFCRKARVGETTLSENIASHFRSYKRKYYDMTSGFDDELVGSEDLDLIYKMEEVAPVLFLNKALYKYRYHEDSLKINTIIGLISNIKSKYKAYIRRRNLNITQYSFLDLIKSSVNIFITIIKVLLNKSKL